MHYQQIIAEVGEEIVKKYYESMSNLTKRYNDHTIQALHDGMQVKLMSYLNQFYKSLALTDPALKD